MLLVSLAISRLTDMDAYLNDPLALRRVLAAVEHQRNQALSAHAFAEAKVAELTAEIESLREHLRSVAATVGATAAVSQPMG